MYDQNTVARAVRALTPACPQPADHEPGCRVFGCRCGCDRAQDCQDCQDCSRCACWRAECSAEVAARFARRREQAAALRPLLETLDTRTLSDLREILADAEEAALRRTAAERVRRLVPDAGLRYALAVFDAQDSKLGMGHAEYRYQDVELYIGTADPQLHEDGQEAPYEITDLNDDALTQALGALAALLRPDEGDQLTLDLRTPRA